jgi:hypothetical protein
MDGLHHALEDGIQELPRLLRIAVGQELHGALEVGEEHRDLFTLTFEPGLRGEDLVGEVLRRVALGRGETLLRIGLRRGRLAALVAEPGARRQPVPARRASQTQTGAASEAEVGLARVLVLAPGALHAGKPPIEAAAPVSFRNEWGRA